MKLTNYIRDAFVTAVMQDVPHTDYQESVRKLITDDAVEQLPEPIKAIVKAGEFTDHLENRYYHVPGARCLGSVTIYNMRGYQPKQETIDRVMEYHDKHEAQEEARNNLRDKLRAAIYSVTTLKAAQELLPDLIRYLPTEHENTIGVPAVANLVQELSASGWK